MIAKVRIAPFERWCHPIQRDSAATFAGMTIQIDAASMCSPGQRKGITCGGRIWRVAGESVAEMERAVGLPVSGKNLWACEHVLEMD